MWIPLTVILLAATPASPAVDASKLTLSVPTAIVDLDMGKLKGDLFRLSWSPDGKEMYVQTVERDRAGNIKATHHYLLALDGKPVKGLDEEPVWSSRYWAWKSGQSAPGLLSFKIEVDQQRVRRTATAVPMGGDLARGGVDGGGSIGGPATGMSTGDAMSAAAQSQMVNVFTLKLKGAVVGEFVNTPAIPGLTFGWAPTGTGLIAFANPEGRIVIMDDQGRKQPIASKAALLPAWTADGARLAYLEKSGRNKATLKIVDVTQPQ